MSLIGDDVKDSLYGGDDIPQELIDGIERDREQAANEARVKEESEDAMQYLRNLVGLTTYSAWGWSASEANSSADADDGGDANDAGVGETMAEPVDDQYFPIEQFSDDDEAGVGEGHTPEPVDDQYFPIDDDVDEPYA